MLREINKFRAEKGSMMVEALAMLGLISMVTPILYKKAAERTSELQDISSASQVRTLVKSMDDYMKDNYATLIAGGGWSGDVKKLDADELQEFAEYLPYGFMTADEQSKMFDGYDVALKKQNVGGGRVSLTGMVLLPPMNKDIPIMRTSKLASMVGGNGGMVADDADANPVIEGSQGGWSASLSDYGFKKGDYTNGLKGAIAATSIHSITANSTGGGGDKVLHRADMHDGGVLNTMNVELKMAGNAVSGLDKLISNASDVTIQGVGAAKANLTVTGNATMIDLMANGLANITGNLSASGGNFTVVAGAMKMTGTGEITGQLKADGGNFDVNAGAMKMTGTGEITGKLEALDKNFSVQDVAGVKTMKMTGTGEITGKLEALDKNFSVQDVAGVKTMKMTGDAEITDHFKAASVLSVSPALGGNPGLVNVFGNAYVNDDLRINKRLIAGQHDTQDNHFRFWVDNAKVKYGFGEASSNLSSYLFDEEKQEVSFSKGDKKSTITNDSSGIRSFVENKDAVSVLDVNNSVYLSSTGRDGSTKKQSSIYVSTFGVNLSTTSTSGAASFYLSPTDSSLYSPNFTFDNRQADLVVSGDFMVDSANVDIDSRSDHNFPADKTKAPTYIRKGVIELATNADVSEGKINPSGYVRLDRIVSNNRGGNPGKVYGSDSSAVDTTGVLYDEYQVNPAYTSVMHDIKLTTRGGARLSDILPEFINKGIYVIDNTYAEEMKDNDDPRKRYTLNWGEVGTPASPYNSLSGSNMTVGALLKVVPECAGDDAKCPTSPWLGFVPTPQCPPGYSKVIAINPIRWKMSEAYRVAEYGDTVEGTGPGDWLEKVRYPRRFEPTVEVDSVNTPAEGTSHGHDARLRFATDDRHNSMPFTFQTNTWLNTTVNAVRQTKKDADKDKDKASTFYGWSAIMGFLYYGSDYLDYTTDMGIEGANDSTVADSVVWNLFPVYNKELTAITNVYCYFERRASGPGGSNPWDKDLVDTTYNQLSTIRVDGKKDSTYEGRLNDPTLKYTDPW